MDNYIVTFSYQLIVSANSKDEAEAKASTWFDEIMPRTDEMTITTELERN